MTIRTLAGLLALAFAAVACGDQKLTVPAQHSQDPDAPSNPADPTDPGDPEDPTDSADPADPATPDDPSVDPGEDPVDPVSPIPPGPPPVIEPDVQRTYEFTMTLPAGTRMLTDGMVTSCPSGWVGECPPYYAFTFEGYDTTLGFLYNFTVAIDQMDTGNRGNVTEVVDVQPDGRVVVTPTALSGSTTFAADAGAPPAPVADWGAAAARARSANHEFYFQLNANNPDQVVISALFAQLMAPFRVTVVSAADAQ